MKLLHAARFAAAVFLVTVLYTLFVLSQPLSPGADWPQRSEWLAGNSILWRVGGWLVLLAIFAWMVLLVALMYSYIPAHRIATMLQSGLMVIGALLLIGGVILWMNLLPQAADGEWAAFVDHMALTFLGAGLFMAGAVTAWIAVDLVLLQKLPWEWILPGILAGALAVPSPFLLPNSILLVPAAALFFVWAVLFAVQRRLPAAYAEMSADLTL